MRRWGEEGFTLIEVLLVCSALGILASIAVPKFTNALALANTAKIQADLAAIDTAADLYELEKGQAPASLADLRDYLKDADTISPPKGNCRLKSGDVVAISAAAYSLKKVTVSNGSETRAYLGDWTVGDFGR